MEYKKGDLCSFLLQYQVGKGSEYTHTSIIKPSGSFFITSEGMPKFYKLYRLAMTSGEDIYLTEKHRDVSPILIDLDFRFDKTLKLERSYTQKHIEDIVSLYMKKISQFVKIPELVKIYVMEKPSPIIDKNFIKDGIHIVIPDIVTRPVVQLEIRKAVLAEIPKILDNLSLKNEYEDVIDEAVISRNNWQMYGSKKPNCESYKITTIFAYEDECLNECDVSEDDCEYVETMSIRNKYDETPYKSENEEKLKNMEKEIHEKLKMAKNNILQKNKNNKKNTYENMEVVAKLVDILSTQRANSYDSWIRVGWCLRNIDHRLLDIWSNWSRKSPKFVKGECERIWNYMKEDGLGMGTLHMWAKEDNPEEYKEINKVDLNKLIDRSQNVTDNDIARVLHFLYQYQYVCVGIKQNIWYEFRDHRWVLCDSGHTLRAKLSNEASREYLKRAAYWSNKGASEEDETERDRCAERAKRMNEIALKLKKTSFKDNIMKECRELFYVEKFEEKLDSRCHLIGFENGVYDLEILEFREGRPEDFISFTTGTNYVPYESENVHQREIQTFLSQVFVKENIREYVMLLLASFLNGSIREERFHIWTGSGSNSKSKTVDLFEQSFGEYCCKLPITLLTQKRAASNAASSELARTKGKRFACLQEPSEDEKLNVGLMKELTGGDKIMARALFKEPIEFRPQFKMILTCNTLPHVPSDDGGTWRRIRVVEFTSRFCDNPDPENPNEFPIDTELSDKFPEWKEPFMSLLIEYYKKYTKVGIKEPEEVLQCTREYQKSNDIFLEFVEQELIRSDTSFMPCNEAIEMFKAWVKDNNMPPISMKKKDFIKSLGKTLGKTVKSSHVEGWKGWMIRDNVMERDELDT